MVQMETRGPYHQVINTNRKRRLFSFFLFSLETKDLRLVFETFAEDAEVAVKGRVSDCGSESERGGCDNGTCDSGGKTAVTVTPLGAPSRQEAATYSTAVCKSEHPSACFKAAHDIGLAFFLDVHHNGLLRPQQIKHPRMG